MEIKQEELLRRCAIISLKQKSTGFDLKESKTNRHGSKREQITLGCNCGSEGLGYDSPCPVHLLVKFILMMKKKFASMSLSEQILVDYKNQGLRCDLLKKFIKRGNTTVSQEIGIKLNPKNYTPHSLRVGGCTDLCMAGASSYKVSIFG